MSLNYLNEIEQNQIQVFLDNPTMKEAVKKVILAGIYFNGVLRPGEPANPTMNFALAMASAAISQAIENEKVGEDLKARAIGIGLLKDAFEQLESLRKVKVEEKKQVNPAR